MLDAAGLLRGARVLDIGCGCGDTTIAAAVAVAPDGHVVGVDVSEPMLVRARDRAAHLANTTFALADAATFVPDAPFDVVISRFGVMFFDDPTAAFANVRRAMKPGGRLVFVCWQSAQKNAWASVPLSGVLRVVPPPAATAPEASSTRRSRGGASRRARGSRAPVA